MMQDYPQELMRIKNLLTKVPNGMSITDISKALNKSTTTIGRYLDILLISGLVEMRTFGMAKVFTLSDRMPISAMLSFSNDLVIVLDEESRIIEINENFLNLLNLSRSDTVRKNLAFLNPLEPHMHELLGTLQANHKENTVTFQSEEKGERFFKKKSIPIVFENGKKGLTIILEDITGQIISERETRESEERFRLMAENIQDGLIIMENGKIVYVNNRLAEITGYLFEELWQMNPVSIVDKRDKKKAKKMFKNLGTSSPEPAVIQLWIIRKDGKCRYVYVRSTVLQHAKNTYVFIVMTDITQLRSKEIALRETEQRFQIMAKNIQEGLIIIENGKIVFSNRRINEITGYSAKEMRKMGFTDLISWEKHVAAESTEIISLSEMQKIEDVIRTTRPGSAAHSDIKVWIQRKDGRKRLIQGKITAAKNDGLISKYITVTDITEYAEKEEALRDRIESLQKLES